MKDNILFQSGCTCDTCLEMKVKEYKKAYQEWQSGKRDIVFDTYYYRCGDGCCDSYETDMYINDFKVDCDGESVESVLEFVLAFLRQDNVSIEYKCDDSHLNDLDDYEWNYDN